MLEDFYFDSSVSEGLDRLESIMSEIRDANGRVWFQFTQYLYNSLTICRLEMDQATFDPIMIVKAVTSSSRTVETIGSVTTYSSLEDHFSIVEVNIGTDTYSRNPSSQMWSSDTKLFEEYPMWTFHDEIPDDVEADQEGDHNHQDVEIASNDENSNSRPPSFEVSTSQFAWESSSVGNNNEEIMDEGQSFEVSDSELRFSDSESDEERGNESE